MFYSTSTQVLIERALACVHTHTRTMDHHIVHLHGAPFIF